MKSFLPTYWDHQGRKEAITYLYQQMFWSQEPERKLNGTPLVLFPFFKFPGHISHLLINSSSEKLICCVWSFVWANGYIKTGVPNLWDPTCAWIIPKPSFPLSPWKNCFPGNRFLMPKRLEMAALKIYFHLPPVCTRPIRSPRYSNQNPESQNGEAMHPRSHSLQRAKSLISFGPALSIIPLWNVKSLFENCLGLISTFPLSRILIYKQTATLPTLLSSPPISQVYPNCSF